MECMYILLKLKLMAKSHGLLMKSKNITFFCQLLSDSKCSNCILSVNEKLPENQVHFAHDNTCIWFILNRPLPIYQYSFSWHRFLLFITIENSVCHSRMQTPSP